MRIAVISNKGGTGKTTTSVNLSAALANLGYRVLLVDLDSQGSASLSLGVSPTSGIPTTADVLLHGKHPAETIVKSQVRRLDLIPGGIQLAHSDVFLADVTGRERRLSIALNFVPQRYDFVVCDCAPSLSLLPVNALLATDAYVVPITPEHLALEGLKSLMAAVDLIERGMGVELKLLGIVFNMVKSGRFASWTREWKSQAQIMELVRARYGRDVFETAVRRDQSVADAPARGYTVLEEAPRSHGALDFASLAREVLGRCGLSAPDHSDAD
jgi:chromosome partitioning protein